MTDADKLALIHRIVRETGECGGTDSLSYMIAVLDMIGTIAEFGTEDHNAGK